MTLPSSTFEALCLALDDEYKARATYRAVIAKLGPVMPFANIVNSEQCHIDALLPLFAARGWAPPADRWEGNVAVPESTVEACRLGVVAEIENAALYDRLFAMTADAEVLEVFAILRSASADRHLPAFQRGAAGDTGSCCGGEDGGGHHHRHAGGRCCGGHRGRGTCAA
ncbi:MAG: DUF2202 domain-containing protein [Magnetospirillum sp.]|nr:DUF2202 domain-containing protein [Magnetospirillum sp.]